MGWGSGRHDGRDVLLYPFKTLDPETRRVACGEIGWYSPSFRKLLVQAEMGGN